MKVHKFSFINPPKQPSSLSELALSNEANSTDCEGRVLGNHAEVCGEHSYLQRVSEQHGVTYYSIINERVCDKVDGLTGKEGTCSYGYSEEHGYFLSVFVSPEGSEGFMDMEVWLIVGTFDEMVTVIKDGVSSLPNGFLPEDYDIKAD